MAISTPSITGLNDDLGNLQRWAQSTDTSLQEISLALARVNNLLNQIIRLNNLKKP